MSNQIPPTPPGQPDGYGYQPQPGMAPGTYGYPQQPAAAPAGYGYPAQPGAAPAGYGYPQQPGFGPAPAAFLKTDRSLGKYIGFTIITFGIYSIVFFCSLGRYINLIASRFDGRKTMHYALMMFLVGPLTAGIGLLVWYHNFSGRIGAERARRGMYPSFGSDTFWIWMVLGSFIIVGPFIYIHKLSVAMNELAASYNQVG